MNMRITHARRMNLMALALFTTALFSLAAFHLLSFDININPKVGDPATRGWVIWKFIFHFYSSDTLSRASIAEMLAFVGLPVSMMLVVCAPFLVGFLRGSRPIWWLMTIMTSVCLVATSWLIWELSQDPITSPPRSIRLFMIAVYLNFLGLLFIRREVPAAPEVDPA